MTRNCASLRVGGGVLEAGAPATIGAVGFASKGPKPLTSRAIRKLEGKKGDY